MLALCSSSSFTITTETVATSISIRIHKICILCWTEHEDLTYSLNGIRNNSNYKSIIRNIDPEWNIVMKLSSHSGNEIVKFMLPGADKQNCEMWSGGRGGRGVARNIRDDVECAIMSLKSNINQFLLGINWDDECVCAMFARFGEKGTVTRKTDIESM